MVFSGYLLSATGVISATWRRRYLHRILVGYWPRRRIGILYLYSALLHLFTPKIKRWQNFKVTELFWRFSCGATRYIRFSALTPRGLNLERGAISLNSFCQLIRLLRHFLFTNYHRFKLVTRNLLHAWFFWILCNKLFLVIWNRRKYPNDVPY